MNAFSDRKRQSRNSSGTMSATCTEQCLVLVSPHQRTQHAERLTTAAMPCTYRLQLRATASLTKTKTKTGSEIGTSQHQPKSQQVRDQFAPIQKPSNTYEYLLWPACVVVIVAYKGLSTRENGSTANSVWQTPLGTARRQTNPEYAIQHKHHLSCLANSNLYSREKLWQGWKERPRSRLYSSSAENRCRCRSAGGQVQVH